MSEKIDLIDYYSDIHEEEFIVASINLFRKIDDFIQKYDFTIENNNDKKRKIIHDLMIQINNIDEFNFFIVRCATAIEFSLKGLALIHKFNIFKDDASQKLRLYTEMNIRSSNTYELDYLIKNLKQLLFASDCEKYRDVFKFFQKWRNEVIHFAKHSYTVNNTQIISNLKLLKDYFDNVIIPIRSNMI